MSISPTSSKKRQATASASTPSQPPVRKKRQATASASTPSQPPVRNIRHKPDDIKPNAQDILCFAGGETHTGNVHCNDFINRLLESEITKRKKLNLNTSIQELTLNVPNILRTLRAAAVNIDGQNIKFLEKNANGGLEEILDDEKIQGLIKEFVHNAAHKLLIKPTIHNEAETEIASRTSSNAATKPDSAILKCFLKESNDPLDPLPLDTETNHACLAPDDFPNDWLKEDEDKKPAAKKS